MRTTLALSLAAALLSASALAQASTPSTSVQRVAVQPSASGAPTTAWPSDASEAVRYDALADVAADAAALAPGEFHWYDSSEAPGVVFTVVNLTAQLATVYRDGRAIAVTTVSTGRTGYETPIGTFPILEKKKEHYSKKYNNAPMPFMQRLTWTGLALHAGRLPGRPDSHGCVRLPKAFAAQLFPLTRRGNVVVIAQDDSAQALMRAGMAPGVAMQVGGRGASPALLAGDSGQGAANTAYGSR